MRKYKIVGGCKLSGEVEISGSKNAAVAIIPAALLVDGVCRIENLPDISDTDALLHILESLGAKVDRISPSVVTIDARNATWENADFDRMRTIRASYYFIGSMLGRYGHAKTTLPGGCSLGDRPIDQHEKGMAALGAPVVIDYEKAFIYADTNTNDGKLHGAEIYFDKVSVGATMNVVLAACLAEGRTVLENVAKEPHIVDLANFLNAMGADIRGAGTDTIKINGVQKLHGGSYTIIPDQIEAATYMIAAAATGGDVLVKNVIPKHLDSISAKLQEMNATVVENPDSVLVKVEKPLKKINVKTLPYPGFPTDSQAPICIAMTQCHGDSHVTEAVYDGSRFAHLQEMERMGARTSHIGGTATISGPIALQGTTVMASDLRAGAAMVIAGLCATGTTYVENIHYIERGYQDLVGKLTALGADISVVDLPPLIFSESKDA